MTDRYRWRLWPTLTVIVALALIIGAALNPTVRLVVAWWVGVGMIFGGAWAAAGYRRNTIRKAQRRRVW